MRNIKKTDGSISVILALTTAALVALAVAGSVFSARQIGKEAQVLRSLSLTLGVAEQIGAEAVQARKTFQLLGAGCDADTKFYPSFDATDGFCFPDPLCVQDPIYPDQEVCNDDSPGEVPLFIIDNVKQGLEANTKPQKNKHLKYVKSFHEYVLDAMNYFNTSSHAQGYNMENFAALAVPNPANLGNYTGANCIGTLCKDCATAPITGPTGDNTLICIRIRICPNYTTCDVNDNLDWVVRKIGVLNNPPTPYP